jgi:hypothetical protein
VSLTARESPRFLDDVSMLVIPVAKKPAGAIAESW